VKELAGIMSTDVQLIQSFHQEVAIMWLLRESWYIAQIVGYTEKPFCIIMKYYPLGSLAELVLHPYKSVSRYQHLVLLRDSARAIQHCHRIGIAHLDIKLANFLLRDTDFGPSVVLSDFGLSTVVSTDALLVSAFKVHFRRGLTACYSGPEMFFRNVSVSEDLLRADIYSFSMMTLAFCNRKNPWS
jgi:serine/threonine protein kinase